MEGTIILLCRVLGWVAEPSVLSPGRPTCMAGHR